MPYQSKDIRILLMQARNLNDPVKEEERAAFAQKAGLPMSCFSPHDLLNGPPTLDQVLQYDALMIGGSGEYNVSDRSLPYIEQTFTLLRGVVAVAHPTFASCFGFQMLVEALGGQIVRDPDSIEIGTFDVTLTEPGRTDALFGFLPDTLSAQFGHKERVERLPDAVVNLASTELCRYQAIRIPGKPIWATQFHPELSGAENRKRFSRYQEMYIGMLGEREYQRMLERFTDSTETEELIPRFLNLIAD